MEGRIYLATCVCNSKQYIGQTIKSIKLRWGEHIRSAKKGSRHKFHRAIRKYGVENFTVEEVMWVEAPTKEILKKKLDYLEQHFIKKFDTKRNEYNSTDGGESKLGYITSEETKKKIRHAQLGERGNRFGKRHSKETILKLKELNSGDRNPRFGKTVSEETRRKMSEAQKRRAESETPEQRRKRGDPLRGKPSINRGKKMSEISKKKMSEAHILRYQKLRNQTWK